MWLEYSTRKKITRGLNKGWKEIPTASAVTKNVSNSDTVITGGLHLFEWKYEIRALPKIDWRSLNLIDY